MRSLKYLFNIAVNYVMFKHKITFNIDAILSKTYESALVRLIYKPNYNLLHNELYFNDKKYVIINFDNIKNFDTQLQKEILSCNWIAGLRNINTLQSYHKANSLITSLLSHKHNLSNINNDLDVVAKRVSNLLICNGFFNQFEHKSLMVIIRNTLISDISILLKAYNTKEYKLKLKNYLYFYKALLLISLADSCVFATDILNDIHKDLENNFFYDGGHKSMIILNSLNYLKELSILKDILKIEPFDIKIISDYIDKISLFIKVLRHSNNTLAIFNDSKEGDTQEINLLLSNNNTPLSNNYNTLSDSGYINLRNHNNNIIISYLNNYTDSQLSFEATINKEKIITNLGDAIQKDKNNLPKRLQHSGLMLSVNNQLLKLNGNSKTTIVKKREEDNWSIIELSHKIEELGAIYRKIIYLSKDKQTHYLLGENLLSFENANSVNKIQKAFLRFHIHPVVNQIKSLNKNQIAILHTNKNKYCLNSPDNQIKFSTNPYGGRDIEHEYCNTMDINFDLSKKIIKLEWSLCDMINNNIPKKKEK